MVYQRVQREVNSRKKRAMYVNAKKKKRRKRKKAIRAGDVSLLDYASSVDRYKAIRSREFRNIRNRVRFSIR